MVEFLKPFSVILRFICRHDNLVAKLLTQTGENVRGKELCVMNEICPWGISYSALTSELWNDILILRRIRRDFRELKQLV